MPICSRINCNNEAVHVPQILVWAKGYSRTDHEPAKMILHGLHTCLSCQQRLIAADFLSGPGKAQLEQAFARAGAAQPNWKKAKLAWVIA